jgi:hypothetical protein
MPYPRTRRSTGADAWTLPTAQEENVSTKSRNRAEGRLERMCYRISDMKGAGMPRWSTLAAAAALACLTGTMAYAQENSAQGAPPAELKVGDKAPDFSLPGTDGKTYTLAELKGKYVVLSWFPKAFTGG